MTTTQVKKKEKMSVTAFLKNNWQLYVMLLPAIVYFFVFKYMPLYGIQIAFKNYRAVDGIWGSEWVGLEHFRKFFDAYYFKRLITNTLLLNIYGMLWQFPVPIILAIMVNQIRSNKLKRFSQTTIYLPHFISTVVLVGMVYIFLSPTGGIFNVARNALGLESVDFMSSAGAFRTISVASAVWQNAGYSSILFIAALSGIDPSLYEAAEIDGASIWQKIRYIDLPTIVPTAMMVLILDCGKLLVSSERKVLLLQTAGNITTSETIGTYVYNVGLGNGQFSYTSAIGLFSNFINFALVMIANKVSKKVSNIGLF